MAESLYLAKYIERMGTGTGDMITFCGNAGLREPEFSLTDGFVVTIWRKESALSGTAKENISLPIGEVSGEIRRLLSVFDGEMKRSEMQQLLGLWHEDSFRAIYLVPSLKAGLVEMTIPDKPNSRFQKYRLTKKGMTLLVRKKK
jgi:predicted HTH transcriptional regulator